MSAPVGITVRQYPDYADVKIPRLAQIPAHWGIKRIKYILREIDDRSTTGTEPLLSMRQSLGLVPHNDVSVKRIDARYLVGFKRVQPGDIVVNRMRASIGLIATAPVAGLVSPDYAVFRPIADINPAYLTLLFKSPALLARFRVESKGLGTGTSGFLRLYSDRFGAITIPVPPRTEQDMIVRFVRGWEHHLLNLVRNKRRLIELLNEQKQAIVNRAVTHGVDANVRLVPSGIDWLGEVPAHWKVRALKQVAAIKLSGVDKHSAETEIPVRLCNYTDVYNNDSITLDLDFMSATATRAEIAAFSLRRGDVLITKDSEGWDDIAVPAVVPQDLDGVLCGYHLALIRPDPSQLDGEYLFRAFTAPTLARQFNVAATGVTRYGLSKHAIKTAIFPLPNVHEQRQICQLITAQLQPLTAAVERAQREIDLIREYRTRLIADVVTGKVDVRRLVPEAPAISPNGHESFADLADALMDDDALVDEDDPGAVEEAVGADD